MRTTPFIVPALAVLLACAFAPAPARGQARPDIILETNLAQIGGMVFSPDSQQVLTLGDRGKLWRISDTNLLGTFTIPGREGPAGTRTAGFSPDGTKITAVGGENGPRQWRISDGAVLWTWEGGGSTLALAPDGSFFALGARENAGEIWLAANDESCVSGPYGSPVYRVLGTQHYPERLSFSGDGKLLASENSFQVIIWRVSDGQALQTISYSSSPIALAFAPDGKTLAVAINALGSGTQLYSVTNDVPPRVLPGGLTLSLSFSPDGQLLLSVSSGKLMFWRVRDGALLKVYEDGVNPSEGRARISPDGKLFAYTRPGPGGNTTLVVARMPVILGGIQRANQQLRFDWQGGSGRYQVQQASNLMNPDWRNVGDPTTNTATNLPLSAPSAFFRIQSLTNAP